MNTVLGELVFESDPPNTLILLQLGNLCLLMFIAVLLLVLIVMLARRRDRLTFAR